VNTRPRYYGRRYYTGYSYPYAAYPAYPLGYYGAYDLLGYSTDVAPQTVYVPYPVYSDSDTGLAEQMRQQKLGMYAATQPAVPATSAPYPNLAPGVDMSKPYPQRAPVAAAPEPEQPATVLIYRDGHQAEVRNYAIVGQTLWIFSEERAQKVPLAQLDLDATRKINDARGVEFMPVPR